MRSGGMQLTKSRNGCRTCKTRRVKCDEQKPACGNCIRRFKVATPCDYINPPPSRQTSSQEDDEQSSSANGAVHTPILRPPALHKVVNWRNMELRLTHHYATEVAHTLPVCAGHFQGNIWTEAVPQYAFESSLVLNCMLALAALHLHAHRPRTPDISLALSRYIGLALKEQGKAVHHLEDGIREQAGLSAVILAHIHWLLPHGRRTGEAFELPLQSFDMILSVMQLFNQKQMTLERVGYRCFGFQKEYNIPNAEDLIEHMHQQYIIIEENINDLFDGFEVLNLPLERVATYEAARAWLLMSYRAFYGGVPDRTLRRCIWLMAVECGPDYRELLTDHDPLAMALYAWVLVLMKGFEETWWMNGVGVYEVVESDITGICTLMPEDALWCMTWATKVLSGEQPLQRLEPF